jgi:hypothetical protein
MDGWPGRLLGVPHTSFFTCGAFDFIRVPATNPAVQSSKTAVRPPISTIPCEILYSLANPVILFGMFATFTLSLEGPAASLPRPTRRHFAHRPSRLRPPLDCHPERSAGSAFPRPVVARSLSPGASRRGAVLPPLVSVCGSPYRYQSMEFTLPLFSYSYALFCTVKNAISNRFMLFRTLCAKHPGWGSHPASQIFSFRNLTTLYSLLVHPEASRRASISFRIRTSTKRPRNSRRIRTSKTQHLKSFRIRTYKKTGEGAALPAPLATHYPLLTTHFLYLETPTPHGASLYMYVQERPGGPGTQVLTMRRFLIAIASLAVLPAIVSAQGRGMMSGMARPAMAAPAPRMAMGAPRPAAPAGARISGGGAAYAGLPRFVRTRSGAVVPRPAPRTGSPIRTGNPIRNGSRGNSGRVLRSQDVGVPGLGFDYPHFAATHPNGTHDRDRDRDRGFFGGFVPFFSGGGYYMPLFPDDIEDAPAAEPQAVDNGESAPEPIQSAGRPGDYEPRQNRPPAAQVAAQAAPEPAPEPYVFVRRDGTVFFATAYAWENGTLRYITSEGLRRTVTSDKLDLNATQQFNEQRGLTFRSPA